MIRISGFLNTLRVAVEKHVAAGKPLTEDNFRVMFEILAFCEAECTCMENRLSGSAAAIQADGNVVSLAAFMARRTGDPIHTPKN